VKKRGVYLHFFIRQDAEIRRNLVEEPNFEGASSHYLDAQFDYDDQDIIDYDYFNFGN
jgi:hypothetical protein